MVELSDELSFEDAFAQLEEVLTTLESGDLSLEESMSKYELGAALSAFCERKLEDAELRVRQWQTDGATTDVGEWEDDTSG